MSTVTKPRPMRISQRAQLVRPEQFAQWHEIASAMPNLDDLELGVLGAVAQHYEQFAKRGHGMPLSRDRLALRLDVSPAVVKSAIQRLVALGLVAVKSGRGGQANRYAMALPTGTIAAMAGAAATEAPAL